MSRYVGYAAVLHMEIIYLRSFERGQSCYHSLNNNRMFERGRRVLRTLRGVTLRKLRGRLPPAQKFPKKIFKKPLK